MAGRRLPNAKQARRLAYEPDSVTAPAPARSSSGASALLQLEDVAKLAAPHDNAYIATRDLPRGAVLSRSDHEPAITLACDVLEGHRFARDVVATGALLTSWHQPFGRALCPIAPGEWVRNSKTIRELQARGVAALLPAHANFGDLVLEAPGFDEALFRPGQPLPLVPEAADLSFAGFARPPPRRGVGTRNYLLVFCISSRSNALARAVEARFRPPTGGTTAEPGTSGAAAAAPEWRGWGSLDGVVALPHTEDGSKLAGGAEEGPSAHRPILLRTLLGLLLHPNVGAAVVLEHQLDAASATDGDGIGYASLHGWAQQTGRGAEMGAMPHQVVRVGSTGACWDADLDAAVAAVSHLLSAAGACHRTPCRLSGIIAAQQCGGSDAFSGTCANPLVGAACKLLIERGGSALLAETDELIGAEAYILSSVADTATARRFVAKVRHFHAYARAHGASAEGNPSGGNLYRGLYNVALKSLGAATKKHPDVRLERVLDYAEPILMPPAHDPAPWPQPNQLLKATDGGGGSASGAGSARVAQPGQAARDGDTDGGVQRGPGYCFMDSPGNDLESIAGQVASGSNLIFFTTGSGSVSNFPFVPTIKIVSTHLRFERMAADMDVDAGAGLPADGAARDLFDLSMAVASGKPTKGEAFGHHQLQIWRAWAGSSAGAWGSVEAPGAEGAAVTDEGLAAGEVPVRSDDTEEGLAIGEAPVGRSGNGELSSASHPPPASPARRLPGKSGAGGARSTSGRALVAAPMAASAARWLHLTCDSYSVPPVAPAQLWEGVKASAGVWGVGPGVGGHAGLADRPALAPERVALILPTSLCSAQVAAAAAAHLQAQLGGADLRVVALPHTEGCGVSDVRIGSRLLLGHLTSPLVAHALLLEHGCEKTHNAFFAEELRARHIQPQAYGWASLQADGGVAAVKERISRYVTEQVGAAPPARRVAAPLSWLTVGIVVGPSVADGEGGDGGAARPQLERTLGLLAGYFGAGGGSVVMLAGSPLLRSAAFTDAALAEAVLPTLRTGEHPRVSGIHVVGESATGDDPPLGTAGGGGGAATSQGARLQHVETLAVLGAAGVGLILCCHLGDPALAATAPGHPMIRTISVQVDPTRTDNADVALHTGAAHDWLAHILAAIRQTASGRYTPLALQQGNLDFQLPRGGACSL